MITFLVDIIKKISTLILLFSLCQFTLGQGKYAVSFADKNNSTYSITHPQAFLSQQAIERRQLQNIAIVDEDLPVNTSYIDSLINLGIHFLYASKWMNLAVVAITDTTVLTLIANLSFVTTIDNIEVIDTGAKSWRKYDKFAISSSNEIDYGQGDDQIKIMEGDFLHRIGYKGEEMTIAVVDAGFNNVNQMTSFSHLWNENRILGYWDFVNNDDSVFNKSSHGTSVLSTIAANAAGQLIGTAPQANFWLFRTENTATETISEEYNWLAAAEFADSVGVDIINTSLGYTTFDDPTNNHTYADMDGTTTIISRAANIAASKGMIVVNSAGNSGNSSWKYIGAPADAQHVLTVGAVNHDGSYASFSSQGPTSDGRVKPNVVAIGRSAAAMSTNDEVVTVNGTSSSSPIMAGMVACLWQAFPNKTAIQIKTAVEQSANQYNNPDNLLGYGIPNFKLAYFLLSDLGNNENKDQLISLFPQPFTNYFNVVYYAATNQTMLVKIHDISGRLVYEKNWELQKGNTNLLEVEDFSDSSGIYFLSLQSSSEKTIKKIMKR